MAPKNILYVYWLWVISAHFHISVFKKFNYILRQHVFPSLKITVTHLFQIPLSNAYYSFRKQFITIIMNFYDLRVLVDKFTD
jgi:hypothetical protein